MIRDVKGLKNYHPTHLEVIKSKEIIQIHCTTSFSIPFSTELHNLYVQINELNSGN